MSDNNKIINDFPEKPIRWKRILVYSTSILILIIFGIILYNNQNILHALGRIHLRYIIYLMLIGIITQTAAGYSSYTIYKAMGKRLNFVEWFGLPLYQAMTNYIIPFRGGAAVTAIYLKNRYKLGYSKFISCFLAIYTLFILTTGPIMCLLFIILGFINNQWHKELLSLFTFLSLGMWALWLLLPKIKMRGKVGRKVNNVIAGYLIIHNNPLLIYKLIFLTWIGTLLKGVHIYFAMEAVGLSFSILDAGICGIVLQYSVIFKILPGNFGIQEGTLSLFSVILGYPADLAMAAALFIRGIGLITKILPGLFFAYILNRRLVFGVVKTGDINSTTNDSADKMSKDPT